MKKDGELLCLLITRRRHICIHVRTSFQLAALTFSLNVIVCNNLMSSVSLLWPTNSSIKSLPFLLSSWLFYHLVDCLHVQFFFSYTLHYIFVFIRIYSYMNIDLYIYIDLIILQISTHTSCSEHIFR